MRILRIADVPDNRTGGMSRAMYATGDEMRRRGHEVCYLFHPQLQPPGPAKLRRFTLPRLIPKLVHRMMNEGQRFDVVEIHEPLTAAYCWARRWNHRLPPVVVFSHGLEERGYAAELTYRRAKDLPISLKFRISPHTQIWQSQYAVRHADHVLCCNQQDRQYLVERGVPIERLTRHQNGVDQSFLDACATPSPDRRPGVLFVSTWLMRKGILEVQHAVTQLLRSHPLATFTAAGTGVDDDVVLEGFPVDVRPRIKVIRSVTSDTDLAKLYRQHTIFLLPSYFEGQPIVLIEAAAAGLAVITTNICGMLDFVEDGINGRLVPVGDEANLTRVLDELWLDPAGCTALGQAARQTAELHTWSNSTTIMLAAYARAVETHHRQTSRVIEAPT